MSTQLPISLEKSRKKVHFKAKLFAKTAIRNRSGEAPGNRPAVV
jgi:hypothetical protein